MCPHSVPLPPKRGELRNSERRSEGSIEDRLRDGGGETFGTTEGHETGSISGEPLETKVGERMVKSCGIPRSKPGNSGDKTQSIRKSLSAGEIPIEAESPLATKVTVRFWGCWWFRKVDPGGVGGEDGGTNYR
jgi:hypothetical protein